MNRKADVVVIGGGPAGLAAALQADAAGASVLVLERDKEPGGILQQCIHNGFGLHYFGEELTGPEYAGRFIDRVKQTGIEILTDTMVLEFTADRRVLAVSAEYGLLEIEAGAIVLAMGCRERTRGALSIPGTRPAGVFTAGCAQRLTNMEGYMPGRQVVILGSGDIGLIMARRMTWEGAKVMAVCELMPYSSGLNRNIVQCLVDNDIPLKFNHTVVRIHGRERVEAVTISEVDVKTKRPIPGTEETIPCDTLLLSVGLLPENELSIAAGVEMDRVTSGAVVDEERQTSIPGVFACGNVLHVHDLVDNVSHEAELAGRSAAAFAKHPAPAARAHRVIAEGGVRYAVPQMLSDKAEGKIDLYFRVGDVYRGAALLVKSGERTLLRRKKPIMTPGEMEKVTVDVTGLTDDVHLSIETEG
ncbi:MAG TPA: FAD-dependent oxidoreductase [Candidatus Onthenecus intestinigallinarum]|uniref:FAD-dependent oxidoreductase n=1 Tax=Candidatus Onthenecus intestinigallinarum TaxID=2840875 RepID=A0A9D1CQ24_9FIRM|nr:FAD-dependent oxidoreductase [Candidatus Onthenecus intestinigallinarum]